MSQKFYAQTYDLATSDWPGELDFYKSMIPSPNSTILEIACGTGRVALYLAQQGNPIVGIDHSAPMIEVAQQKSADLTNVRWLQADMRDFDLDECFDLILIPGHAFQFMCTPDDQVACLTSIKKFLNPNGRLIIHVDHVSAENTWWLGDLCRDLSGKFEPAEEFKHPESGNSVRAKRAWSYEPVTQTAIAETVWEEINIKDEVVNRWESGAVHLHCVFRFEMEHLLRRVGFEIEALYGDFYRAPLDSKSTEIIWVARL